MKLLFSNSIGILLLVSSALAKLHEEKIVNHASGQGQEGPKFGITRCANDNERVNNEYIIDVSSDVSVRSVMNIFELNFPKGKITRKYKRALHGFAVAGVTEDEIQGFAVSCDSVVVEIIENAKVHKSEEWGLDRVDERTTGFDNTYLPNADGAGVSIYILDTGVKVSHREFQGRITEGIDFTGEGQFDGDGHGTHVAGMPSLLNTPLCERYTILSQTQIPRD
jgi:subtilisin family serine protease